MHRNFTVICDARKSTSENYFDSLAIDFNTDHECDGRMDGQTNEQYWHCVFYTLYTLVHKVLAFICKQRFELMKSLSTML